MTSDQEPSLGLCVASAMTTEFMEMYVIRQIHFVQGTQSSKGYITEIWRLADFNPIFIKFWTCNPLKHH